MTIDAARHEAAHAAAVLTLGRPVSRVELYGPGQGGVTRYRGRLRTLEDVHGEVAVILAALAIDAETVEEWEAWTAWPLEIEDGPRPHWPDRRALVDLIWRGNLDERGWRRAVQGALWLTSSDEFERTFALIVGRLDYRPTLDRDDLRLLLDVDRFHNGESNA